METITTNDNNTNSKEPTHKPTNEDLMKLFKQYSDFTPPTFDLKMINVIVRNKI